MIGPKVGFTDARALCEAVLREFSCRPVWESAHLPPFLDGRCALIRLPDGRTAGTLGEIDPAVLVRFGLENPAIMAELDVEALAGREPRRSFELEG